jgi:hypothetical protein
MSAGAVLPGVELFATGIYRGKRWTLADLQQMAANAKTLGPQGLRLLHPPAVFGHEEDQPFFERTDWPAAGFLDPQSVRVQRYYDPVSKRMEGKLIGDITDVPPAVEGMMKSKRYKKISAEIYDDFEDDFGNHYGKAIRRMALLGAEVPQVKRLKDLPTPEHRMSEPKKPRRLYLTEMKSTGHGTTVYTFAEQEMDRTQLVAAIQAAMPGMSQATLDSLKDDQLAELVKNLPGQAAALPSASATGATAPATNMADWDGTGMDTDMYADMPREDLIDALSDLGQDANALQGMSDDELQALYDELSDQGATQFADDPATMSREDLIAALTQAGQDPTTITALPDDQLQALYTQILGGTEGGSGGIPSATVADGSGGAAAGMADCQPGMMRPKKMADAANGITTGQQVKRGNPNGAPAVTAQQMSEQRRMMRSARKLHTFAEKEFRRMKRSSAERRRQDAESFCDRLVGEGRLTPALKQEVYLPLLLSLDDSHSVWKFSENGVTKQLTAYEVKKAKLAKMPIIVRMGERFPGGTGGKQAAQGEVNKVERFCEVFGDKLKIHGFKAKETIELAKKKAEADPNFKASDLIGADAARMVG